MVPQALAAGWEEQGVTKSSENSAPQQKALGFDPLRSEPLLSPFKYPPGFGG